MSTIKEVDLFGSAIDVGKKLSIDYCKNLYDQFIIYLSCKMTKDSSP